MTSHGYLYEILVGLADKAESQAERAAEAERREPSRSAAPIAAMAAARQMPAAEDHAPVPAPDKVRQKLSEAMKRMKGIAP
jgi:membrane peptidoglycan carboxypeptidase